ncbi:HFL259Wp [Eremothecium sinecaudum]|uniref:HFL259Wp n=1 Tax=Eremothecium sinecaudum TaxID=45286 RepID=A0A0X8HUB0_9SACH|nr:HFL259Wp [Eremothecium sinecaudum]AMD21597.1 HFL259Wp [Eremothecium sinecaudum]
MESFSIVARDKVAVSKSGSHNDKVGIPHPDDSARDAVFLTNIKHIFDDDDDYTINLGELGPIDSDDDIEHVILIQVDSQSEVKKVELISDEFQLLNYELESKNDLVLNILSKFPTEIPNENSVELSELIARYRMQNNHLAKLINDL